MAANLLLFSSSFEDKMKIVFNILDFDNNMKINQDDIATVMSHIPLEKMVKLIFVFCAHSF